jgi:hypothetical protein
LLAKQHKPFYPSTVVPLLLLLLLLMLMLYSLC